MSVLRITAKPIVWDEVKDVANWMLTEPVYGFHIEQDLLGTVSGYNASWGECDEQNFEYLEDAKQWCQEQINAWVAKVSVVTITNE